MVRVGTMCSIIQYKGESHGEGFTLVFSPLPWKIVSGMRGFKSENILLLEGDVWE